MKNFESMPGRKDNKVTLTAEELEILRRDPVSPESLKLMQEKGIHPDSGDIEIEVEGEKKKITTKKEDFGVRILSPDEKIISSGVERNPEE
jgi:hypothetical protein